MKTILFFFAFLFSVLTFSTYAQEMQDVIYLKNGDILKGTIIENVLNDYVRIEIPGGSQLTIHYSDIQKLIKERVKTTENMKNEEKTAVTNKMDAEKLRYYEQEKKSNGTAILLSILLSSTGHAYAGNWGAGLLYTAERISGVLFAITVGTEFGSNEINGWFYVGMGMSLIAAVMEVIDASHEVDRYNKRLYNSIMQGKPFSFNIIPNKYGARLQLTFNF